MYFIAKKLHYRFAIERTLENKLLFQERERKIISYVFVCPVSRKPFERKRMAGNGPNVRVEHPNRSIYLNTEITVNHENLAEQNSSTARQFIGTFLRQITDRIENSSPTHL